MSDLPATHRALVVNAEKGTEIREKPIPQLGEGDVLVQVKAVTLNPTDWKHQQFVLKDGASLGSDFAGIVVRGAGNVKEGDRVAGFIRGGAIDRDNGTFSTYVKSPSSLVWKVPEHTSFEEAAAMGGIGSHTAIWVLGCKFGLADLKTRGGEEVSILVWSGATSVGHYAVQLAKIYNLKAFVTASPKHHEMLKTLGAYECFDYRDPDVVAKIKEASRGLIKYGLDTVSQDGSTKLAAQAMSETGGLLGTIRGSGDEKKEGDGWPENVQIKDYLIYDALKPENAEDFNFLSEWNKGMTKMVENGTLQPNPIKHRDGSLEAIPDGLEYLRSGKVSGEKLAYTLA